MLQSDFMGHLARKGALRDAQVVDSNLNRSRRDGLGELDWGGLTKLTQAAFADELAAGMISELRRNAVDFDITYFDLSSGKQGIVHVVGPEQGITQPGTTIASTVDATRLPRTISAAARRSSMRALVQEPKNTRSTAISLMGVPGRRSM